MVLIPAHNFIKINLNTRFRKRIVVDEDAIFYISQQYQKTIQLFVFLLFCGGLLL